MVTSGADLEEESLMMREALADAGVADRDQLGGGQAPEVGPDADAADADHRGDHPEQVDREKRQGIAVLVLQRRQDVVAEVDQNHRQHPERDAADDVVRDLEAVRQQGAERDDKVAEEYDEADVPPLVRAAVVVQLAQVVPEGLLGHVGAPDQEVLGERHVRPEDGEREHELADAVEVVGVGDALEVAAAIEPDHDERVAELPEALTAFLKKEKTLQTIFDKLSYTHQKEYAVWIASAKKEETLQNRLTKFKEMLLLKNQKTA